MAANTKNAVVGSGTETAFTLTLSNSSWLATPPLLNVTCAVRLWPVSGLVEPVVNEVAKSTYVPIGIVGLLGTSVVEAPGINTPLARKEIIAELPAPGAKSRRVPSAIVKV